MKNRLWKMMMVSGLLVSAMAVSGVGPASVLAAEETEASDESDDDVEDIEDYDDFEYEYEDDGNP